MRSTSISTLTGALFLAAVLTGCAVAPYDDTYYDGPYFEGPYNGAPYHGGRIYRHGDIYLAYPHPRRHRQASPHRVHRNQPGRLPRSHRRHHRRSEFDRRDWRDGDGEFNRRAAQRQERATKGERAAQRKAGEVRAHRRTERQSLPFRRVPRKGAQTKR